MEARFDWQIRRRSELKRSRPALDLAILITGLFAIFLTIWLSYHYLFRPEWINNQANLIQELFPLLEAASIFTLAIMIILLWWRGWQASISQPTITLEELVALSPAAFEKYVAQLFRQKGYKVKLRGRSGDAGVDLEISQPGGRRAIVQCKKYRHTIGPEIVRELFGTMIHERVHHAFLVTTAEISNAAREWAAAKPITLIDGAALVTIASSLNHPSIK